MIKPSKQELIWNFAPVQNATAGTKVFQVVANDPDDPNTSNGKIVYSLPDDGTIIRKLFQLDPGSGVLTTKVLFSLWDTYVQGVPAGLGPGLG